MITVVSSFHKRQRLGAGMAKRFWSEFESLDRPALGTWSQIAAENCIDILGESGFDFTIIDMEHGSIGIESAARMVRACDASGLLAAVRVARPDPYLVGQALDLGAGAVVVPGVESPEQAQSMVSGSRFAPEGSRGACITVRAGGHLIKNWGDFADRQRAGVGVIAMVENRAGVDAIEEICSVEGLSGLMIGPFDLSVSLGCGGDHRAPKVSAAIETVTSAAQVAGIPIIAPIFSPSLDEARLLKEDWLRRGASHFVLGIDKILFAWALSLYKGVVQ